MKMKTFVALVLVLVSVTVLAGIGYAAEKENPEREADIVSSILASVPRKAFGGLYYNDAGELVLNIKEGAALPEGVAASVIIERVPYVLAEIEAMKALLAPFMVEYGIATLDANDVLNTVDIELYYEHGDVEALIASIPEIDPSVVRISVFEEGASLRLT